MSKHKTIPTKIRGDDIRWILQPEKINYMYRFLKVRTEI